MMVSVYFMDVNCGLLLNDKKRKLYADSKDEIYDSCNKRKKEAG